MQPAAASAIKLASATTDCPPCGEYFAVLSPTWRIYEPEGHFKLEAVPPQAGQER